MKGKFDFLKFLLCFLCVCTALFGTACAEMPAELPVEAPAEDAWKHQVTNTEILKSESFLDAPDSVVYYDKAFSKMRVLSEEEGTRLETAFAIWSYELRYVKSVFEDDPLERVETQLATYGGIEFRYSQRRTYTGRSVEYTNLKGDRRTWHPGVRNPYDAVLMVPNGARSFWLVFYLNGEYQKDLTWEMTFDSQTYTRFCTAWQEVLGENVDVREPVPQTKLRDGAEYTLTGCNTSMGLRMYDRLIDGVTTEDYFMEFYDQDDNFKSESRSEYTLTVEDEAAARALLERFGGQMIAERKYHFSLLDGVMTLFEQYEEDPGNTRVMYITMRFDPETGERVLYSKEPCC